MQRDRMGEEVKTCSQCGKLKPLGEYYNHHKGYDGKAAMCKSCHNAGVNQRKNYKLRKMIEDAYEVGAQDGYANVADKSSRDNYVERVLK